jgi:hypothetical protein
VVAIYVRPDVQSVQRVSGLILQTLQGKVIPSPPASAKALAPP